MKGLAPPDTLTGKIQRALTDEWQSHSEIVQAIGVHDSRPSTVRACLERLCSEDRAEWQIERTPLLSSPDAHGRTTMSGGMLVVRWRKPTGDARTSQRADGAADSSGDDGNAGTPVAPMEPTDGP